MNLLVLVFILFIVLVISMRIHEILKEKQAKEERRKEETTEPTTIETTTETVETETKKPKIDWVWRVFWVSLLGCAICAYIYSVT